MIKTFNAQVQRKQKIIYAAKLIVPIIALIVCIVFYYDRLQGADTVLVLSFLFVYFYYISYSSFRSALDSSGALKSDYAQKYFASKDYEYVVLINIKNLHSITTEYGFRRGNELICDFAFKLGRFITYSYYPAPIVRLWSGYFLVFFRHYRKDILHKIRLFELEFGRFELDMVGSQEMSVEALFDSMHQKKPTIIKPRKIQEVYKSPQAAKYLASRGFSELKIYSLIGANNTKEDIKKLHFIKDFIIVPVSLKTLQDVSFYRFALGLSKNIIFEISFELIQNFGSDNLTYEMKKNKTKINQIIARYRKAGFLIAQNRFFYPFIDIDIAIFDIDFVRLKDEKTAKIFDSMVELCRQNGIMSMSRFAEDMGAKTDLVQGFYYHKAIDFENFKKEYLCLCQS